jgi:hypothetical protein
MNTAYLFLTLVVGPLVGGGVVCFIQSKIRVNEARETAEIRTHEAAGAAPYQVLQQQLAAKDAMIASAQSQHHAFVETQMARNDASTRALLELAEQIRVQTANLKDMSTSLQGHKDEAHARAGRLYEKIGEVNERLATIEAKVKAV